MRTRLSPRLNLICSKCSQALKGSYIMVCSALYFTCLCVSYVDFPRQKIPYRAFYVFRLSYCLRPAGLVTKMTTTSIVVSTTPLGLPRNAQGVIMPFSSSSWRSTGIIGTNAGTPECYMINKVNCQCRSADGCWNLLELISFRMSRSTPDDL